MSLDYFCENNNSHLKFPLKIKIMIQCHRKLLLNSQNKILIKSLKQVQKVVTYKVHPVSVGEKVYIYVMNFKIQYIIPLRYI